MTAPRTCVVLLNAGAGAMATNRAEQEIRARFAAHGVDAEVRRITRGDDISMSAKRAVTENAEVIVAGGGDGTLNAVANAVVGSTATFGVIPLGTLNHFAKDLGIPVDVGAAVDAICTGRVAEVDVGRVNGRVFLNNSSLGLYPEAVRRRDKLTQRLGGGKWPAFVWSAWSVLRRHPFLEVRLTVEDNSRAFHTPLVFIGNNSYELDGLKLGGRNCLDAGHLSIHVVGRTGRLGLVVLALRGLFGRLRRAKDFATFCAPRVEVWMRRSSVMVATDGEVERMQTPLIYTIEPRTLRILVPAERGIP